MATNTFKNKQAASVTSATTIYTAPNGKDSIMLELDIANTTGAAVDVTVKLYDASASTNCHLIKETPVLSGASMKLISGQKIVLEGNDYVQVTASGAVDVQASILEDVN